MTTEWGALGGVFPIDETYYSVVKEKSRIYFKRGLAGVPSDADGNGNASKIKF